MSSKAPNLPSLIDRFPERHVLVIGDLILDHYLRGSVARTSPEAPVPVLAVESEEYVLGGAGNVAANILALGAKTTLISVVGNDEASIQLKSLHPNNRRFNAISVVERGRPTTVKTRCVSQGQQMLRYDRETTRAITAATQAAAMKSIRGALTGADAIILSDYGKGFLTPAFIAEIISVAKKKKLPVLVDPKGTDYTRYKGATLITPNQKEASEASGTAIVDEATLTKAATKLQKFVVGDAIVITRGAQGVAVYPKRGKPTLFPARAREVFDVTGAGDTFIATFTLAMASGATLPQAAELANVAGGIVVGMEGVATIDALTLRAAFADESNPVSHKIATEAELVERCEQLRSNKKKIVFTNGYFDLLHHGHIRLLEKARALGDCLIVAINSDESTRRQKGEPRPILRATERAQLLAALPFVDYVVIFKDDTPEGLLRSLAPDVLVKGARPGEKTTVVGRAIVERNGGKIALIDVGSDATISAILDRALTDRKR